MKWWVSCFEPFNGAATNSSMQILEPIRQMNWQGRVEFFPPLPVEFNRSWEVLRTALTASSDIGGVLALGQAEGRARISGEILAHNWFQTGLIDTRGPDLRWSAIPWSRLNPSPHFEVSHSAGSFVCNEILYHLCGWAEQKGIYAGFVHVPLLPEPMTVSHPMVDTLAGILRFALSLKKRIRVVAGIIENSEGQVLLARRPEGKHLAGHWEFPGGKIENGESPEKALQRELNEELKLDVTIQREMGEFDFAYDWGVVGLRVFVVRANSEPQTTADVPEFHWVRPDQVELDSLMPADVEPLQIYRASRT